MRRRGPTRHRFNEDPEWLGYCMDCNLPEGNAIHDLPERSDDEREHEARRVGDRE